MTTAASPCHEGQRQFFVASVSSEGCLVSQKSRKTFICKWPIWIVKYCMQTMYVPDLKALP